MLCPLSGSIGFIWLNFGIIALITQPSGQPLSLLYGHEPNHFGISCNDCPVPELATWLEDQKVIQQILQQQLHRAQQ